MPQNPFLTLQQLRAELTEDLRIFARTHSILNGPHITAPELDVTLLIAFALKTTPEEIRLARDMPVSSQDIAGIKNLLERRKKGEPVSKMIGSKGFWDFNFIVSHQVLDPRPDSETLIEAILTYYAEKPAPMRLLDLGTGSGCLLLTLLSEFPEARGVGIDCSQEALAIAAQNAEKLGLGARASFQKSNWFEVLDMTEPFDLILSNPPYIPERHLFALSLEVKHHDPICALNGGEDGLDAYRAILKNLRKYLKKEGIFCLEIGYDQRESVSALLSEAGFKNFKLIKDLGGQDRCILGAV